MTHVIDLMVWWTGATVWFCATLYGLSDCAMWVLDKFLKRVGLWPDIYRVMRRYYQERNGERPAG